MENKVIKKAPFKRVKGVDLDSWLENEPDNAMKEPIIIEKPDGLGMKMPPDGLTVEHVAEYIGEDVPLEVIGQLLSIPPISKLIMLFALKTSHPNRRPQGGT